MPRLLVAVAFGLIAAACEAPAVGPEVTTTVPVTTTSLPADADQAIARFGECLVRHEVEVPAIPLDARGRPDLSVLESSTQLSSPRFRQAMVDCAGLLTTGGFLELIDSPALLAAVRADLADYSACMRSAGVEGFPDPKVDFNGTLPPYDQVPVDDPDLASAIETCGAALTAPAG